MEFWGNHVMFQKDHLVLGSSKTLTLLAFVFVKNTMHSTLCLYQQSNHCMIIPLIKWSSMANEIVFWFDWNYSDISTELTLPVFCHVSLSFCRDEFKLGALHVEIKVCWVSHLHNVYFQPVVSPGTELEFTHLVIKWEVRNVYIATASKDSGCEPGATSIRSQDDFGFEQI